MSTTESDSRSSETEELDLDECWRLLQHVAVGRLAVSGDDGYPDVVPLNYIAHDRTLLFRTSPGMKLRSIERGPHVAFEIDGQDGASRWSVVVRGKARRLTSQTEIDASGINRLISWSPVYKDTYVRLTPDVVTGRRFGRRRRADLSESDEPELWAERDGVRTRPSPIPHRPPLHDREADDA